MESSAQISQKTYPPLQGISLFLLILGIGLGTFMEVLDITITNVSIPDIAGELDVSPYNGAWIISSYAIGNGITLLLAGFFAKRFGEVKVFVTSIIGFVSLSFCCGLATNFTMLLTFRVLQGLLAGPLIPLSQSLLLANFPEEKKPVALTAWSLINVVAPILGPILGGYITDNLGWRWIFFVNVPIGIIGAFITWQLLRNRETKIAKNPIDLIGLFLLIVGISCLQIFLDKGNDLGWFQSNTIILLLVGAIVSLSFFSVWTWTAKYPLVDIHLFKKRNFTIASLCAILAFISIYGGLVVYPLWLETQMHYNALWAGLALMPFVILILLGTPVVMLLIKKGVDLRYLITISFFVFILSSYLAAQYTTSASFESLLPPRLIIGLALSFFFIPGIMIAMSGIENERLANATSLFSFQRILGVAMGSSIGVAIFQERAKVHYHFLASSVTNQKASTMHFMSKLEQAGFDRKESIANIHEQVISQAYMLSINDFFLIGVLIFIFLCILIWFAKPPFTKSMKSAH